MKLLFHSNAPWNPSGYGQQVALFAPRLAHHAELAISAFHGLQGSRLRWEGIEVYPAYRRNLRRREHPRPRRALLRRARGGLVLTLLDVPVLDAQRLAGARRRCLGAGRP